MTWPASWAVAQHLPRHHQMRTIVARIHSHHMAWPSFSTGPHIEVDEDDPEQPYFIRYKDNVGLGDYDNICRVIQRIVNPRLLC